MSFLKGIRHTKKCLLRIVYHPCSSWQNYNVFHSYIWVSNLGPCHHNSIKYDDSPSYSCRSHHCRAEWDEGTGATSWAASHTGNPRFPDDENQQQSSTSWKHIPTWNCFLKFLHLLLHLCHMETGAIQGWKQDFNYQGMEDFKCPETE